MPISRENASQNTSQTPKYGEFNAVTGEWGTLTSIGSGGINNLVRVENGVRNGNKAWG